MTGTPDHLARWLTHLGRFAPEDARGEPNRLPVALLALARLGARDDRLSAWAESQVLACAPAAPAEPWPSGDGWPGRLGDAAAWPAYRGLFAEWIEIEGATEVLEQVLPGLLKGCGAAGFQGAIRVASAARSGHRGELADALAYWASRFLALGAFAHDRGDGADPERLLRTLHAVPSRPRTLPERMRVAARDAALRAVWPRLAVDRGTLERLARLSAQAYAATGDATARQLVSACHALRVLLHFVDEPLAALPWIWQAWSTAVVSAGFVPQAPLAPRPWPELVAAAVIDDDARRIALVEAAREEEKAYGGEVWRAAATRAMA